MIVINKDTTVYISGPMTGYYKLNKEEFDRAERFLNRIYGCKIINPTNETLNLKQSQYKDICRAKVKISDIVICLNGFENSIGAKDEIAIAVLNDIPVVKIEDFGFYYK